MKKLFIIPCMVFVTSLLGCNNKTPTYTVSFNSNGGEAVSSIVVKKGEKIAKQYTRLINHEFVYWSPNEDLSTEFNFDTAINNDLTLHAKWKEGCSLNSISASAKDFTYFLGQTIYKKDMDVKGNYSDGYTKDLETSQWACSDLTSGYVVTDESITMKSKKFHISETITKKYLECDSSDVYFANRITPTFVQSITLASPSGDIHAGDTNKEMSITVIPDGSISKEGLIWESDNPHVARVDSSGKLDLIGAGTANISAAYNYYYQPGKLRNIRSSCVVTVLDSLVEHIVQFDTKGGTPTSETIPQKVKDGYRLHMPTINPTKDEYIFQGWFTDEAATENKFDFNLPIKNSFTLYAGWKDSMPQCTVTFNSNGGTNIPSQTIRVGTKITEPTEPVITDQTSKKAFIKWTLINDPNAEAFNFDNPITNDITLYAQYGDWWTIPKFYKYTSKALREDIGLTRKVQVNGVDHTIRLIGVDEDIDDAIRLLHTTWMFEDLISDENGCSLAMLWNDEPNVYHSNQNYGHSTLRRNLVGKTSIADTGSATGYYQKGANTKSQAYSNKTVLDMFNDKELVNAMKEPQKDYIEWQGDGSWQKTFYSDKLFLNSCRELGNQPESSREHHAPYTYFKDASDGKRCKGQANRSAICFDGNFPYIHDAKTMKDNRGDQLEVRNYAGYGKDKTTGDASRYWTRSPRVKGDDKGYRESVYFIDFDGTYHNGDFPHYLFKVALPFAPCFCL